MKIVNPRDNSGKLPHDWRQAWDAFTALRSKGKAIGEPVSGWKLEAPSGAGRMLDRRWKLTYSFKGTLYHAYVGLSGQEAAFAIKELTKGFNAVLEGVEAENRTRNKTKPVTKLNPIYDAAEIIRARDEYNADIVKVKDAATWERFKETHKRALWLLSKKAGFLEMSVQDYLFKHPHAQFYPTPPANQKQYDNRQREIEKMIREKEQRRRYDRS